MSVPELICPQTTLPCKFAGYCALNKALAERDPSTALPRLQALLDDVQKGIPAPLLEAQRSSWCSEERVRAIGEAVQTALQKPELDSVDGHNIIRWGAVLAAGTLRARQKDLS